MRKIAHFIDSEDPGGAETLVLEICCETKKLGLEARVIHFGNPWLEHQCRVQDIEIVRAPGKRFFQSVRTLPLFSLILARFLIREKIDVIHSHLWGAITGACVSACLARIPHVGTLHDVYTIEERRTRVYLLRLAALLGTRLVAVSRSMEAFFQEAGGFTSKSLTTIPNGVDLREYAGAADPADRRRLGLEPDDLVLICVGRLVEIKAQEVLIDAVERLPGGLRVKLLLVGDGERRRELEDRIRSGGTEERVRLLGQRDDIRRLLKASDCFVLSSRSEGLSRSIIEALASGLPVVATDVGGNRELVQEAMNGYLVPPDNPVLFADRLKEILEDKAKREQFAAASLRLAEEKYSLNTMMASYMELYQAAGLAGASRGRLFRKSRRKR